MPLDCLIVRACFAAAGACWRTAWSVTNRLTTTNERSCSMPPGQNMILRKPVARKTPRSSELCSGAAAHSTRPRPRSAAHGHHRREDECTHTHTPLQRVAAPDQLGPRSQLNRTADSEGLDPLRVHPIITRFPCTVFCLPLVSNIRFSTRLLVQVPVLAVP